MSQEWVELYRSWIFPVGLVGYPQGRLTEPTYLCTPYLPLPPFHMNPLAASHLVLLYNIVHHEIKLP